MQPVQFFTRSQVISDISYASDNTLAWTSLGAFMTNVCLQFIILIIIINVILLQREVMCTIPW